MATTHLTFEQAAERLGISPEDFKKRLKTDPLFKDLDRGKIRDGTSFRFKESAVEELSRQLGAGSDPENPIPTIDTPPAEEPLNLGGDDDVFSLTTDEPKPAPAAKAPPTRPSGEDSEIRLEGAVPRTNKGDKSDKHKKGKNADAIATEEVAIDFGSGSGVLKGGEHSGKLSAPRSSTKLTTESGKNLAKPGTGKGEDSEFELSLDAESADDFEIKLNTDTSDEDDAIGLGDMPKESPGGSRAGRGGESGILSRKPADTGRSLEKSKGKDKPKSSEDSSDADVDFELTLDSGAGVSSSKLGGAKPGKLATDSDSEFELTLDEPGDESLEQAALSEDDTDGSKGDIFETDFEIPPMEESASEAVALEASDTDLEKSDFDVAIDDTDGESTDGDTSGSEVVLLEDEEEAPTAKGKKGKPAKKKATDDTEEGDVDLADVEAEEEEEAGIGGALKGVKGKRRGEEEEEEEVPAGAYRPVPWGVVPALFLLPAFALALIGGLMGYELLQTAWGYQQPRKPAAPIVRAVAQQFDMELKDQ